MSASRDQYFHSLTHLQFFLAEVAYDNGMSPGLAAHTEAWETEILNRAAEMPFLLAALDKMDHDEVLTFAIGEQGEIDLLRFKYNIPDSENFIINQIMGF